MRYTHDVEANTMYFYVVDLPISHTEELEDGTVVDVAESGELVGVEILAVSRGWDPTALSERFTVIQYDLDAIATIVRAPAALVSTLGLPSATQRETKSALGEIRELLGTSSSTSASTARVITAVGGAA